MASSSSNSRIFQVLNVVLNNLKYIIWCQHSRKRCSALYSVLLTAYYCFLTYFFKAGLLVDDHRVVARHKRIWNYKTKDEYEPEQWLLNFEIKIE